jgi:hypothetical protein
MTMLVQGDRHTLEDHTPALDRFDKVFGALGDETESALSHVDLENAAQSLLRHDGQIVGIVHENPG